MPFLPFQILSLWLRGLLSLALFAAGFVPPGGLVAKPIQLRGRNTRTQPRGTTERFGPSDQRANRRDAGSRRTSSPDRLAVGLEPRDGLSSLRFGTDRLVGGWRLVDPLAPSPRPR